MSETYAINLADWMRAGNDAALAALLRPVAHFDGPVVNAEPGRPDGMSLQLACPADRARAVVETIRQRYEMHRLRLYRRSGATWSQV